MSFVPGLGIVKGMALTMRRFFEPKATIMWPEAPADVAPRFRGRLQLLYDEYGTLKCETCFQCAQACPIECIDMGGKDTKGRYHVHWGPPETYAERREEAALRRAGRPVPDAAYDRFSAVDLAPVRAVLEAHDSDPAALLAILEETQAAYGHLPVAALKEISFATGAWYAIVYGTASSYRHLRFERPVRTVSVCRCTSCLLEGSGRIAEQLGAGLGTSIGLPASDGEIRLEQLDGHLADAPSPLILVDGVLEEDVTEASAAAWALALTGGTGA